MKKDIVEPKSEKVNLFITKADEVAWDIYLVNENDMGIRDVLIVTEAFDGEVKSSTLRYYLETLDALSAIKIESVMQDVMQLNNVVTITYYKGNDFINHEFQFSESIIKTMTPSAHYIFDQEGYLFQ